MGNLVGWGEWLQLGVTGSLLMFATCFIEIIWDMVRSSDNIAHRIACIVKLILQLSHRVVILD